MLLSLGNPEGPCLTNTQISWFIHTNLKRIISRSRPLSNLQLQQSKIFTKLCNEQSGIGIWIGLTWLKIYYNKPTRCSCWQSILFHCRFTLHVSGAFHTHHQEYIKLYLQPPVQVILSLQLPSSNVAKFGLGFPHPSSGVHKTVSTASGTGHIIVAATFFQRGQVWTWLSTPIIRST